MPLDLTDEERRWLTGLHEFDRGNRLALFAVFAGFGEPQSYLDLGCGTGAMVLAARQLGIDAWGVDILPSESPHILARNLEQPLDLNRTFDLVTSIETAEHIHLERADILCDTYARHLKPGGLFILTAAAPGQIGDGHVNCVIGETEVSASGVRATTRRWYDGQTVTVITRGNNELTVTPNHPVLTVDGWMPARLLQVGDNVLSRVMAQGESFNVMPNDDQSPTAIQEVFSAFAELQEARRLSVPLTAEDFHGDLPYGEVEIIYPDSLAQLGSDTQLLQPFRKFPIKRRDALSSSLESLRAQSLSFDSVGIPTAVIDGMRSKVMLFGIREGGHPYAVSIANVSDGDTVVSKYPGDTRTRAMQLPTDGTSGLSRGVLFDNPSNVKFRFNGLLVIADRDANRIEDTAGSTEINMSLTGEGSERLPTGIASDEIVSVKRSKFRGHVYNLSTENGWYFANRIITHNCQEKKYWRDRLESRGLKYEQWAVDRLYKLWKETHWATHWCEENAQVFTR